MQITVDGENENPCDIVQKDEFDDGRRRRWIETVGDLKTRLTVAEEKRVDGQRWSHRERVLHANFTRMRADGDQFQLRIVGESRWTRRETTIANLQ